MKAGESIQADDLIAKGLDGRCYRAKNGDEVLGVAVFKVEKGAEVTYIDDMDAIYAMLFKKSLN